MFPVTLVETLWTERADKLTPHSFRKNLELPFAPFPGLRVVCERPHKRNRLGEYVFTCDNVVFSPFTGVFELGGSDDIVLDSDPYKKRRQRLLAAGFLEGI
jgi:hypothetical protein